MSVSLGPPLDVAPPEAEEAPLVDPPLAAVSPPVPLLLEPDEPDEPDEVVEPPPPAPTDPLLLLEDPAKPPPSPPPPPPAELPLDDPARPPPLPPPPPVEPLPLDVELELEPEGVHTPPSHVPPAHAVPSAFGGLEHAPVPGLQAPVSWQASGAGHVTGLKPVHTPFWHVSVCVQPSPSLHVVALGFAGFEQAPVAGSHTPAAWHASLAAQTTGL